MVSTLIMVWVLHIAALVTPGANVLLVTHLAANGDRRAAMWAAAGITLGAVIWSTAAVLGVSALFVKVPALRLSMQVAGAGYLLYVAARMWRAIPAATAVPRSLTPVQALRSGLLTNLSNPKAALFFGSIFTSALPGRPSLVLIVASIALVLVNALAWHVFLAAVFSRPYIQAGYASRRVLLSRLAGTIVGVFGLTLVVTTAIEMGKVA